MLHVDFSGGIVALLIPKFSDFFLKSEGKEAKEKEKKIKGWDVGVNC